MRPLSILSSVLAVAALAGCGDGGPAVSDADSPALVSEADHDHGHEHVHADGIDHDHDHADFDGSHSHDHAHPHRHDDDGTELISIGHTHHSDGVTDYHARLGGFDGERLTLAVLADDGAGELQPISEGPASFGAIVGSDRNAGLASRKLEFTRQDGADGVYAASLEAIAIPEGDELMLVVVPVIELGGERLDFSFPLPKATAGTETDDESDAESDAEAAD